MQPERIALTRQGVQLHAWRAGTQGPRVLLLHGFPEAGFIWRPVLHALQDEARLLAPNQRGYAPSSCPDGDAAYHPREMVADLVELLETHHHAEEGPVDLLVAHDWGGAVAWNLAAQRPDLLRRLLIINAPHPATFLRGLLHDPEQQAASAYMNTLCREGAAERLLADGGARLIGMLGNPTGWMTPELRAEYQALWNASLNTMLAWYRASPLRPPQSPADAIHRIKLPDAAVTVKVPTHVVWGEADTALPPGLLEGLEQWVPHLTIERIPSASHWVVHEHPERVIAAIRRLI